MSKIMPDTAAWQCRQGDWNAFMLAVMSMVLQCTSAVTLAV